MYKFCKIYSQQYENFICYNFKFFLTGEFIKNIYIKMNIMNKKSITMLHKSSSNQSNTQIKSATTDK